MLFTQGKLKSEPTRMRVPIIPSTSVSLVNIVAIVLKVPAKTAAKEIPVNAPIWKPSYGPQFQNQENFYVKIIKKI